MGAATGQKVIQVADASNFAVGDYVRLGSNAVVGTANFPIAWDNKVAAVNTAPTPNTITLTDNIANQVIKSGGTIYSYDQNGENLDSEVWGIISGGATSFKELCKKSGSKVRINGKVASFDYAEDNSSNNIVTSLMAGETTGLNRPTSPNYSLKIGKYHMKQCIYQFNKVQHLTIHLLLFQITLT